MARTPDTVNIRAHELMLLLCYRWAAVNSPDIGELGTKVYEEIVSDIDTQSKIEVTPAQLADLIHHMKEVVFEKVKPARLNFSVRNYNKTMRRLKSQAPNLFKEAPSGEVVMIELEERAYE